MRGTCPVCGKTFEGPPSKRFCGGTCQKRARRGAVLVTADEGAPAAGAEPTPAPGPPPPLSDTLVGATRRQLEDVGRLDTWLGQQALALAEVLAGGRGTPAGLAAASRELRETMTAAMRGAGTPTSVLGQHRDEVAARRQRRRPA